MGQKPEFVPEGMFQGEARPYIPPKSEKEQLLEIEGTIVDIMLIFKIIPVKQKAEKPLFLLASRLSRKSDSN